MNYETTDYTVEECNNKLVKSIAKFRKNEEIQMGSLMNVPVNKSIKIIDELIDSGMSTIWIDAKEMVELEVLNNWLNNLYQHMPSVAVANEALSHLDIALNKHSVGTMNAHVLSSSVYMSNLKNIKQYFM